MKYDRKIEKEIRSWYRYYKNTIKTSDFIQYEKKKAEYSEQIINKRIEKEPELSNRTDHYDCFSLCEIKFYDVLRNEGVSKLLKKLYSLPSQKYKVRNYYKKPTSKSKYDYIHMQHFNSESGIFAEIDFLKDKYIKSIEISWSQIDNFFAMLEYNFVFKKCFDENLLEDFIIKNLSLLNKRDYRSFYTIRTDNEHNYDCLIQSKNELFSVVCQHYITSLFYSEQGSKYQLPSISVVTRKEPINIDKLFLGDFCTYYYNREEKYVIVAKPFDDNNYFMLCGENRINCFRLISLISEYGNIFYYTFLGRRHMKIFEQEYSCFVTERKHIKNKDLSNLLELLHSLTDYKYNHFDLEEKFKKNWIMFCGNKENDFVLDKDFISSCKKIYLDTYEHLKLKLDSYISTTGRIVSFIALGISFMTLVLSFIFHFL
ncbi:MAG: hypothetical protein PUJ72_01665 [Eubacteriales bacterium]|nr:hypothetical protein [Eubacteriales bacterium]